MDEFMKASKQVSLFCRMNMNIKKDLPIRSSEMGILFYLVKTKEEKTANAIAKFFKVTKSMATNTLTTLQQRGYIEKQQSLVDKRSYLLNPTAKAIELVNQTWNEYFLTMALLKEKMGAESFHQLIDLLETANEILWEESHHG